MKNRFDKKNIGIVLLMVIVLGVGYLINYSFFEPTPINAYIASKFYETPANNYFDDDNFYKCVVDTYNTYNNPDVSYTTSLTDAQLKTITGLYCERENIVSAKGIEKLSSLTYLSLYSNELEELDLSKNTLLTSLDVRWNQLTGLDLSKNNSLETIHLEGNPFLNNYNLKKGETVKLDDPIILPSNMENSKMVWSSNRTDIASVDSSTGVVTAVKGGVASIYGESSKYELYTTINVINLTSDRYIIDNDNLVILSYDNDASTIKKNIDVPWLMDISVNVTDNKVYLSSKDSNNASEYKNVATYELVIAESDLFDLTEDYIVIGDGVINDSDINVKNADVLIKESVDYNGVSTPIGFIIEYNNVVLKEYSLISVFFDKYEYDLTKDYVYAGTEKFDISNVKVVGGKADADAYYLEIKNTNGDVLKQLALVEFMNSFYNFVDDYVYVANGNVDVSKISIRNGKAVLNDEETKVLINCGTSILKEYEIVKVNSSVYDLTKDYIYVGTGDVDLSKIIVPNGEAVLNNDKTSVLINRGTSILKEYKIVKVSSEIYEFIDNYIFVTDSVIYENKIKVTNGRVETSGNILKIKCGTNILEEYKVVKISSSVYNFVDDYIFVGFDTFDVNNLNVENATIDEVKIDTDFMKNVTSEIIIKCDAKEVKRYYVISAIIDSKYGVYTFEAHGEDSSRYIFVKDDDFSKLREKVFVVNGEVVINDSENTLLLKSKVSTSLYVYYDLFGVTSDYYDLSERDIYIGDNTFDINKINVVNSDNVNCSLEIDDSSFIIKLFDRTIYTYNLIRDYLINFNSYEVVEKNIYLPLNVSYDDFIGDIVNVGGITYKLFNGEKQVTNGNVLADMKLKVYNNDNVIDEYTVVYTEYFRFDNSLDIDDEKNIINNIKAGTSINDIYNKIDTSGEVSVFDKEDKIIDSYDKYIGTGNKFKIVLSSEILYYTVSVRGDLNGNGLVEVNDLVQVSKHMVKHTSLTDVEFNASDINNDTKVDINDIIKIAKHIVKKEELK